MTLPDTAQELATLKQSITVQSPGRINLIGEHTDYNDGFVLPAAIDKNIVMQIAKNGTPHEVTLAAKDVGESFSFDLRDFSPIRPGWENYIMGVVYELQELGAEIQGFEGSFEGTVPIGGGMSSSAALECSLAYALNELFDLGLETPQLIKASQMAEHHFVGTKCGIMDQFASMMGKKDRVIMLDCRSLEYRYHPLELGDYHILLLNTNVSHSLASSEYNTRRSECEEGVSFLQTKFPEIKNLRDVDLPQLGSMKENIPERIYRRCLHVISENQRVMEATKALQEGDLAQLGRLIYRSHFSLQNEYEVSCPELDFLVQDTLDKDYILGSRMMGGGFGGCTINVIEQRNTDAYVEEVSKRYQARFGIELTPYRVSIEGGTSLVS